MISFGRACFQQIVKAVLRKSLYTAYATLSFVNCAPLKKDDTNETFQLKPSKVEKLTYDYMIKQSTLNAVNNASDVLTIVYTTIEITSNEYRSLLVALIDLLKETIQNEVSDAHWDTIIEIRSKVQHHKDLLNQLNHFMDYVHKMAEAATQMSHFSGMDSLSLTLCQRINDAMDNVKKENQLNEELEKEYTHVQEASIINSNKR